MTVKLWEQPWTSLKCISKGIPFWCLLRSEISLFLCNQFESWITKPFNVVGQEAKENIESLKQNTIHYTETNQVSMYVCSKSAMIGFGKKDKCYGSTIKQWEKHQCLLNRNEKGWRGVVKREGSCCSKTKQTITKTKKHFLLISLKPKFSPWALAAQTLFWVILAWKSPPPPSLPICFNWAFCCQASSDFFAKAERKLKFPLIRWLEISLSVPWEMSWSNR